MASQANVPTQLVQKPIVFLLSLGLECWFDERYARLIDLLANRANIKRATKSDAAIRYLTNNSPSAIIVTDPSIVGKSSSKQQVLGKVENFISNGGTAIFACHFSSFIRPPDMDKFWRSTFDLPWKYGDYQRTTVHLVHQTATRLKCSAEHLEKGYSQKAVFLRDVQLSDALYLPSAESRIQSMVFLPEPVDQTQTPVAWAKYGDGWLGYVGDFNAEECSDEVILAMCGL
ncbi:hypothetical protein EV356DRAFT_497517 [Viridothelium virens]|uniref:ThuA-like domain-containing protein n=1 Tax=Viridothelium virens TaxID=1048519 RepID=A0A6A6GSJ7_VIRVR|nr:hypothetical protein EV356DRAFT_497517 [Viridothelium virens]